MNEFRMPSLGADMESGTIVEWLVSAGDKVARGDVVVLVETEKGIIDVEIWQDGIVETIEVPVGSNVAVGTVIATLKGEGPLSPVQRRRISPRARAVAAELGVGVEELAATEPITEAAVRATARDRGPAARDAMRGAIARTMARSKREIPHYYLATTIDMGTALDWLDEHNATVSMEERIIPAALLLKATALGARQVTTMNGHFDGASFLPADAVHLGVAISLRQGGLVAPAIRACDGKTLPDLMRDLADLVNRARSGRLRESEVSAPTLTVTNLGERGVESGYGIVIPPQVALVCFGKIHRLPAVVDKAIVARPVVTATLSADHRVSDGRDGGRFLEAIDHHLQKPEAL